MNPTRAKQLRIECSMTLVEIVISMAILSVLLVLAGSFLQHTSDNMVSVTQDAFLETKIQNAIGDIEAAIRESKSDAVTMYRFQDTVTYRHSSGVTSTTQDALCLLTARNSSDRFKLLSTAVKNGNTVWEANTNPQWQGIVVYACYNENLYRYTDRRYRSQDIYTNETNPLRLTSVTSTTITISNSLGTTISFSRAGSLGTSQTREVVLSEAAQFLFRTNDGTSIAFNTAYGVKNKFYSDTLTELLNACICVRGVNKDDTVTRRNGMVPTRDIMTFFLRMRN